MAQFPNQNIPEIKKDLNWVKEHFRYAESLLEAANSRNERFTRLFNTYNGISDPMSTAYLTNAYGKRNKTKYISYRIARPKIDLINNEFLQRPLQSTVYTINESAKTAKLDNYEFLLGAAHAKEAIGVLNESGVDPLNGMEVPDITDTDIWNSMSTKDKNQEVMQTIINEQIPALRLKEKLAKNFQDLENVAMCYGKVEVDHKGDENYKRIDPRDSIFEEIENDTFIERSPVMGHREKMPIHDILLSFNLGQKDAEKLENVRMSPSSYVMNSTYRNRYFYQNGQVCADVIFLEWKSIEASYFKKSPKTKAQLEYDSSTDYHMLELNTDSYLKSIESYNKDVKAGKYEVITKYKEVLWEAIQIGDDIIPYARKKQYTMRRVDKPADVLCFSYTGALFNTVNGERVSLMEIVENFSNMFDITMYQILKELNKAKGKVLGYNRGALPKGTTLKNVMYNALNDSFIDYDSTGIGNMSGKDIDITNMFKEIDLGMSSSFSPLIALKQEILATVDRLTGINENRQGQIAASSTASNAQESIQASRTITEGLFYLMSLYSEKVLLKVVETTKITWGLSKVEKGKIILGDAKFKFMQVTKDIAYQDYGVHITDSGKEMMVRAKLDRFAESALNAKDLRFQDLVKFELSETLADATKVLEKAFQQMTELRQKEVAQQQQGQSQLNQQQLEAQMQMAREDREDKQRQELDKIVLKGDTDIRVNDAKSNTDNRNKMIVDQNKFEQEAMGSQLGAQ
jgi:hypothetical protein